MRERVPEAKDEIREIEQLVDDAIRASRDLTFDLSSALLYEVGLEAAILEAGDRLTTAQGITFSLRVVGVPPVGCSDTTVLIHRAVKEIPLNAVKHARATSIRAVLTAGSDRLEASITNDGVGFDSARHCHLGDQPA